MTSLTETLNSSARKWRNRAEFEHAGHADDLVRRQSGKLLQRPDHRVERIGDADDEGVGRVRSETGADRLHNLEIDAEQVVAAHARLPRHAGGDDDDVGAGDGRIVARAGELGVKALDRTRLSEIERLALRDAVDDVEEDDVAEFLKRRQMRQGAADLAGPDQSNLLARHGICPLLRPLIETAARHDVARPREARGVLSDDPPSRSSRTFGAGDKKRGGRPERNPDKS